ncbi:MAG: hypothetical protein R3195_03850, partial [Gemmatimonadota bacterium]|nr:hypothetical protein [Gemmatimonadota bacterium]
ERAAAMDEGVASEREAPARSRPAAAAGGKVPTTGIDLESIGHWLSSYVEAARLRRPPELPERLEIGTVTGLRVQDNSGTVVLSKDGATTVVVFEVEPRAGTRLPSILVGSTPPTPGRGDPR